MALVLWLPFVIFFITLGGGNGGENVSVLYLLGCVPIELYIIYVKVFFLCFRRNHQDPPPNELRKPLIQ